jgi:hypothetical protein
MSPAITGLQSGKQHFRLECGHCHSIFITSPQHACCKRSPAS